MIIHSHAAILSQYRAHKITARLVVRARSSLHLLRQYPSPLGMSSAHLAEREDGMTSITFTIFFEDPFWVGVVERQADGALQAARHVFGTEPGPAEVLEFVLGRMNRLIERSSVMAIEATMPRAINPKRAAREAGRALAQRGSSTQSQEAIRLQLEQNKQIHKQRSKAEREAEADYKRQLKVAKAKARHRGR
jgi:hypothetical protein